MEGETSSFSEQIDVQPMLMDITKQYVLVYNIDNLPINLTGKGRCMGTREAIVPGEERKRIRK